MKPNEAAFEEYVSTWLVEHGGYVEVKGPGQARPSAFDPITGIDTEDMFAFLGATQSEAWDLLKQRHGGLPGAQTKFVSRLAAELDKRGTVDVLRHGVIDHGITIQLAYFRPAHGLSPDLVAKYNANRLNVTRQLLYQSGSNKAIDLGLFINGLLVATAELKNQLTNQSVEDAINQYRTDRDPNTTALARRAVVHFAVDTQRVAMTTRLAGGATRFLPFNRGDNGGAGNSDQSNPHGHRTAYLWEQVWKRDAWLDLLGRFVHVQPPAKGSNATPSVIFPRWHQWDAVLALEQHARLHGAGQRYLVQHSAGSGKSNTIGWLTHRLSSLHDATDTKVFDKVIVITDRLVLDSQLQETIYQFEHAHGVVAKIDDDSTQLAEALSGHTSRIIVTTLQKFPYVLDKVTELGQRRYVVVVDEAHSSQTGDAAKDLRMALGATEEQELTVAEAEAMGQISTPVDHVEEALAKAVAARGLPRNLSFFAFTATPKAKTLELFGTKNPTGKFEPFHLYSMRQAIEEGFILDVLSSYVTYQMYWRLEKAIADDPTYEAPAARRAIARFVGLHEHNLSQKAEIIIEHFRTHVSPRIGGRAKAMVVTSSRLHAVRYKRHLDKYLANHGYGDVTVHVAFSGTVNDDGIDVTEAKLNGFPDSQTAKRFDDEGNILVVAEKYQTGFDQPLLYAMYVDKVLTGLNAVQTLSRLNRIADGKDGTFVLDFRNDAESIREAFEPWFGKTIAPPTDPNLLYDTRSALDRFGVLLLDEVVKVAGLLVTMASAKDHGRIHAALQPAIDRFHALDADDQELFRDALDRFVRTYSFLSQLVSFGDTKLERDYLYCRSLGAFVRRDPGASLDLGSEVELTHLRHEMTYQGSVALTSDTGEVRTISDGMGRRVEAAEEPLSQIITKLNERYGLKLTEADRLHFEGIAASLVSDPILQQQAAANNVDNFRIAFEQRFNDAVVDRLSESQDLTYRILDNPDFRSDVIAAYLPLIYGRAKVAHQEHCAIGELLARGEDAHLEYKSTFRWDLRGAAVSKNMETAVLKTVAAFLNSREGGTLLIGIADDGAALGLESDYLTLRKDGKDDADLLQLALTQAVLNSVGAAAATNVTSQMHAVGGNDVCRVHIKPSGHPVYAEVTTVDKHDQHQKKRLFYVRMNNGTRSIDDESEIEKYIGGRWGK
jgi:type I restriction enzyme, R subunit